MARVDLFDGVDMGNFHESDLIGSTVIVQNSNQQLVNFAGGGDGYLSITGLGLTYDGNGVIDGGLVTGIQVQAPNHGGQYVMTGGHTNGSIMAEAYYLNDATISSSAQLSGDDVITVLSTTPPATDTEFTALGWGGNDLMIGGGSRSSLDGGDGNDTLQANAGDGNYLRGEAGDDSVVGAAGFDDINGNMGNDTLHGGAGDDWVVGGKDNDVQFGDAGGDVVWGNLGADTLDGGDGADQVRGGQGDDIVNGGAGDDYVSGDRGNDTITGGAGADLFHGSQDAGIDKVLDFHVSEGDRVLLDPGTTFTVSQEGADTVIDMGHGNAMILVGVPLGSLNASSILLG